MPNKPSQLEAQTFTVPSDTTLKPHERQQREATLRDITARIEKDGKHTAKPHPDRARQFMPFAALKGYHELAHNREHAPEQKHAITEEHAMELSETISRLTKGNLVSIKHYEGTRYITTCGLITEINETFRTISIVKKKIAFENIFSIESLPDKK